MANREQPSAYSPPETPTNRGTEPGPRLVDYRALSAAAAISVCGIGIVALEILGLIPYGVLPPSYLLWAQWLTPTLAGAAAAALSRGNRLLNGVAAGLVCTMVFGLVLLSLLVVLDDAVRYRPGLWTAFEALGIVGCGGVGALVHSAFMSRRARRRAARRSRSDRPRVVFRTGDGGGGLR